MSEFDAIKDGYKVPNIVHQTFISRNLPPEISKIVLHNKRVCSQCKFIFYDDEECDNFIKTNFEQRTYDAYKKINDVYGAMKADFFRYCVLYKIGGIYLDIKSLIKVPLFKLINKSDICILDKLRNDKEPYRIRSPTYEQWLLIFAPNHPYLLEMINLMVHCIEIQYTPKLIKYRLDTKGIPKLIRHRLDTKGKILHVTGPDAFTKAIKSYVKKNNNKVLHRCIDYDNYFEINILGSGYKKMYSRYNKKHYSQYNEPLYKQT